MPDSKSSHNLRMKRYRANPEHKDKLKAAAKFHSRAYRARKREDARKKKAAEALYYIDEEGDVIV